MEIIDQAEAVETWYQQPFQQWQANAGEPAIEEPDPEPDDPDDPEPDDPEPDDPEPDDPDDPGDDPDDPEPEEEEFEEVEIDGQTYTVPKGLKENFLMHSDYTRKTQEVAETRRQLEEQQQQFQQQQERYQKNFQKYAQLAAIDQQLKEYEQVDWNQLQQDNPGLAQQHQFTYTRLKNQRDGVAAEIQQAEHEGAIQEQQNTARRMEEASRKLSGMVENWSPQKAQEVATYMQQQGVSPQVMQYLNEARIPEAPQIIAVFHKAMQHDQALAKAKQKPSKTIKPSKKVRGKSKTSKRIDDPSLTTEERIKRWQKGK